MKKPELLAPVGNKEALVAAISAGCDAVYLSGKKYGARAFAYNFSNDELVDAIKYCHLYGVKVYVTVNTIIYENEVDDFINYVDFLHINNVDAVIMQDIGMIDLVRKVYPNLEIHVSTQVNIHNLDGVKFFEDLGINRVVLGRETSIDTIKNIKENSNMELEVFIHGALCISYSGQCLMSSLIGGRSGNRGMCAGCCRLPYDLISNGKKVNHDKYLLSTKDLMVLDNLGDLISIGVDSFKIEGRMKRPEYVYLVVSLYRKAIDSYFEYGYVKVSNEDIVDIKKIFNRGFTKGYLFNEKYIVNQKRPNHMGITIGKVVDYKNGYAYIKLSDTLNVLDGIRIVGNDDVGLTINKILKNKKSVDIAYNGDVVAIKCDFVRKDFVVLKTTDYKQLKDVNDKISSSVRKINIQGFVRLKIGDCSYIEVSDGINKVFVNGDVVLEANNSGVSLEQVCKQIDRLGNTIFNFDKLDIDMDDNIFIPVSSLNGLRRRVIELLEEKRLYNIPYKKNNYNISLPDFPRIREYSTLISSVSDYDEIKNDKFKYIYIDSYKDYLLINDERLFYKLPRVNECYREINARVLASGIGSLYHYNNVDTDFSFNVVNSYSVAFLHSLGVNKVCLSYELNNYQIKDIIDCYHKRYKKHPNLEVIINSREEAMVTKFNLLEYYGIISGNLKDKFGNLYPIKVNDGLMYIYNYKKRIIKDFEMFDIGVNVVRIHY